MATLYISASDAPEREDVVKRKPLSISAKVNTHPEFAERLKFYRDSRLMTPIMLFMLDKLIEKNMPVEQIANNHEELIKEIATLLKE